MLAEMVARLFRPLRMFFVWRIVVRLVREVNQTCHQGVFNSIHPRPVCILPVSGEVQNHRRVQPRSIILFIALFAAVPALSMFFWNWGDNCTGTPPISPEASKEA